MLRRILRQAWFVFRASLNSLLFTAFVEARCQSGKGLLGEFATFRLLFSQKITTDFTARAAAIAHRLQEAVAAKGRRPCPNLHQALAVLRHLPPKEDLRQISALNAYLTTARYETTTSLERLLSKVESWATEAPHPTPQPNDGSGMEGSIGHV